ncbi:hypothetical protein WA588_003688 [Blastocystis sp. NMH]
MFRGLRAASSSVTRAVSTLCRATRVSPSRLPFSIRAQFFSNTLRPVSRHLCGDPIPSIRDMRQVVRTFTTAIEAKQQEASQQPSEADLNTLNKVMSSIRDGDFEGARMTLEKLENPKLFSRDIYYLTVYLMYMTDNYRNMGVEEIKKELGKAGLSEEQIMKLERRLRHPTNQQYILEKNLLSGTNNVLTWLLATLACFLLFLLFANMNPSNLLGTSSFEPELNVTTRFSDVIGLGESLDEVKMLVKYLQDPAQFRRMGAKTPSGVLLTGPPGTGKTLLARAVAGEASVPFFFAAGSEFDEMYVGMGAKRVRELFKKARENAPCIVFIDELDAVGGRRDSFRGSNSRQTINQLLNEIGGFRGDEGVLILGATNLKKVLDPALVRAGRFDLEITTSLPDRAAREQILAGKTRKTRLGEDVDLGALAVRTAGMSGAELESLINVAAMKALAGGFLRIHNAHILEAYDRIRMGSRGNRVDSEVQRRTLLHECGHAVVSLLTPGAAPIDKITVVPRGDALGYVSPRVEEHRLASQSRRELRAMMDTAMGGRAAEAEFYGEDDVATGASSDLEQATRIARAMVYSLGMNGTPRVAGMAAATDADQLPFFGEAQRRRKDQEIERLLQESYARARRIVRKNRRVLLRLAEAVEENETISGEDAQRILEGKPMRDCYNVQELKLTEDDLSDAEIFKAQYGGAQQQEGKVGDVVPATAEMEEAMSMIANEMLSIRQDEEKEVFELLLRRKAGLDKDGEGEETQEMQEETQEETQETQETLPPSQSID